MPSTPISSITSLQYGSGLVKNDSTSYDNRDSSFHIKAPSTTSEWHTTGKNTLQMLLNEKQFTSILNGDLQEPHSWIQTCKELCMIDHNLAKLTNKQYRKMVRQGRFVPPKITPKDIKDLKAQGIHYTNTKAAFFALLYNYVKDTDREYIFDEYKKSEDCIAFYNSIVASYESTGQNLELQELKDQLDSYIPPSSDNIMQSFKLTHTKMEIILRSMSQLPKKFRKHYTDSEKKNLMTEILFRDKDKRFESIIDKMNDGHNRDFEKWITHFENLLNGFKMDEKLRNRSVISAATTKTENQKSETSTIPVALATTETTEPENESEASLNATINKLKTQQNELKNLKRERFPNSVQSNNDNRNRGNNKRGRSARGSGYHGNQTQNPNYRNKSFNNHYNNNGMRRYNTGRGGRGNFNRGGGRGRFNNSRRGYGGRGQYYPNNNANDNNNYNYQNNYQNAPPPNFNDNYHRAHNAVEFPHAPHPHPPFQLPFPPPPPNNAFYAAPNGFQFAH